MATMRTFVPSHLVKNPCFHCHKPTLALKNGIIQLHPICPSCEKKFKARYEKQFAEARNARYGRIA